MLRLEPNDVMFAGAGMLWGVVTIFRNVTAYQTIKRTQISDGRIRHATITVASAAFTLGCLGYLAWSYGWIRS